MENAEVINWKHNATINHKYSHLNPTYLGVPSQNSALFEAILDDSKAQ